jgi:hypothetical protein
MGLSENYVPRAGLPYRSRYDTRTEQEKDRAPVLMNPVPVSPLAS